MAADIKLNVEGRSYQISANGTSFVVKGVTELKDKEIRVLSRMLESKVVSRYPAKRFTLKIGRSSYEVFVFDGNVYSIYKDGKFFR